AAAMLAALMLLAWTRPPGTAPNLFRDAVWLLAIVSTALLLSKLLGRGVQRSLWILTAAACLFPLRDLFEQDPLLDRLVLILQAGRGAATLAADLRTGVWKQVFQGRWQRAITIVLAISV